MTDWKKDSDGHSHPINDDNIDELILSSRNKVMALQYHFKKCHEHMQEVLDIADKIEKIKNIDNTEKGE